MELVKDLIKERPLNILRILSYSDSISDDLFYTIFIYRHLLTLDLLQTSECHEILAEAFSSGHTYRFVRRLDEFELLKLIFPSIHALKGIDGGHYHNEEVFTHVMGSLRAVDKVKIPWFVKLSSLYHDSGKYKWETLEDGRRRFTNHNTFGAERSECDLRRLKLPEGIVSTVKTLVQVHMQQVDGKKSIFKLKRILDEQKIPFKYFIWVRYSDNKGSMVSETEFSFYRKLYKFCLQTLYPKKEPSISDLEVNGYTLMEYFHKQPGAWLGTILKDVFEKWQNQELENNKDSILKYVSEKWSALINA